MFYFIKLIKDFFKKEPKDVFIPPRKDSEPLGNVITVPHNPNNLHNSWEQYAMLMVTGKFEGSGYGQVTDNFDGQGLSLGMFQWCIGQGSLQEKILKPYFAANAPVNKLEEVLKNISEVGIKEGLKICKNNFLNGTKIRPEIISDLRSFTIKTTPYQIVASRTILNKAWGYCSSYDMVSLKSFCFFFDVVVQNGSMNNVKKPMPDIKKYRSFIESEGGVNKNIWQEQEKAFQVDDETIVLCLLIKERALNNKWRSDVISRKCTIAHGRGTVHGKKYFFNELFNKQEG